MSQKHLAMITLAAAALSFAPGWFSSTPSTCPYEPITLRNMTLLEVSVDGVPVNDLSDYEHLELSIYDNLDNETVHINIMDIQNNEQEVRDFIISHSAPWEEPNENQGGWQ
ncbi:hypothetical protein FRC96_16640 [Lujinxingia vulgaris]|uniref:Uncharacterized protein n=1 Tax=Lujinxingia vulgaris TaxID=2600176 RepID=A0A5C6X7U5_9DELT|nr:hypothetical protein [Lujinxingia vulgaris]TXD32713.1 hypothetical protein FRC96_16640 [Lujinxingia vulgaris]